MYRYLFGGITTTNDELTNDKTVDYGRTHSKYTVPKDQDYLALKRSDRRLIDPDFHLENDNTGVNTTVAAGSDSDSDADLPQRHIDVAIERPKLILPQEKQPTTMPTSKSSRPPSNLSQSSAEIDALIERVDRLTRFLEDYRKAVRTTPPLKVANRLDEALQNGKSLQLHLKQVTRSIENYKAENIRLRAQLKALESHSAQPLHSSRPLSANMFRIREKVHQLKHATDGQNDIAQLCDGLLDEMKELQVLQPPAKELVENRSTPRGATLDPGPRKRR